MNKKTIFLLLFQAILYSTLHITCMIKQSGNWKLITQKYPLLVQNDPFVAMQRECIDSFADGVLFLSDDINSDSDKNMPSYKNLQSKHLLLQKLLISEGYLHSIRRATQKEQTWECTQYVLAKTIGYKDIVKVELESSEVQAYDMFKYFKETNVHRKKNIVVYSISKNAPTTSHMGFLLDNDLVESKWGYSSLIIVGKIFNILSEYGNYASIFTLRNKFRSLPQEVLIATMKYDTERISYDLKRKLYNGLIKYYQLIGSYDILPAKKLVFFPLSTEDMLEFFSQFSEH